MGYQGDLVAYNDEQYISIAATLLIDAGQLAALRQRVAAVDMAPLHNVTEAGMYAQLFRRLIQPETHARLLGTADWSDQQFADCKTAERAKRLAFFGAITTTAFFSRGCNLVQVVSCQHTAVVLC